MPRPRSNNTKRNTSSSSSTRAQPRPPHGRTMQRPRATRPQDAVPKFDEQIVNETQRTVPVAPVKPSRKAREPMPEPALDHRRQIVGTDEPKGRRRGK